VERDAAVGFAEWYLAIHCRLVASIFMLSGDLDLSRDVVDETCTKALEVPRTSGRGCGSG